MFPVHRGEGEFFTLISQFQMPHLIFTFLDDYRRSPERAEPYMAVTFFTDFMAKKDVVLVRGDFSGHLKVDDARRLLRLVEHYYVREPRLVEQFNHEPDRFDWNRFLQTCPRE